MCIARKDLYRIFRSDDTHRSLITLFMTTFSTPIQLGDQSLSLLEDE
jgi:hypothetical protein